MPTDLLLAALSHYHAGRRREAEILCRQILAADPRHPAALNLLGRLACDAGRADVGIGLLQQAIELAPNEPDFYTAFAEACRALGESARAVAACRHAIELSGGTKADAFILLGDLLREAGRFGESVAAMERGLALAPDDPRAWYQAGLSYIVGGPAERAVACFTRSNAIAPNYASRTNRAFAMNYCPEVTPEQVAEEHFRWAADYADPWTARAAPHDNDPSPGRRLRVGYVSGQFRAHGHALFIEPFLTRHDPAGFEVVCYAQGIMASTGLDPVTRRLRRAVAGWRDITNLDDARAAEQIRADRIDVLVDLNGLSEGGRLLVFARKPAPVQVTYLGYPNTTGMRAMDYRLTDAIADPPGQTEALHRERLVRLDGRFLCFQPPDGAPDVSPPPSRAAGHVTFGSFNHLAKVTSQVIELWSKVLAAVPNSRMALKARGVGDPLLDRRFVDAFAAYGIAPDRILMLPPEQATAAHLARYAAIDVALDTFPYHGTTTTCEAMWMGVPTVSLVGQTHVSRVGASLLSAVGLDDLLADTPEQYVRIASALAADAARLAELRSALRERMPVSPLMDAEGHTRRLERAYRQMWQTWCAARHGKQA